MFTVKTFAISDDSWHSHTWWCSNIKQLTDSSTLCHKKHASFGKLALFKATNPQNRLFTQPPRNTYYVSRHFRCNHLKANKVSKSEGTRKVEYAYHLWKCASAVYQKLSTLVRACRNYSLPKLACFFETQCRWRTVRSTDGNRQEYICVTHVEWFALLSHGSAVMAVFVPVQPVTDEVAALPTQWAKKHN